jgi:hypothetical protein
MSPKAFPNRCALSFLQGAVYFFEADEPVQFPDDFAFTETPDEVSRQNDNANAWAQIGLGAVLIGVW